MNFENNEVVIECLESSIEHWILSDPDDAIENLGEDLTSAVKEALKYD